MRSKMPAPPRRTGSPDAGPARSGACSSDIHSLSARALQWRARGSTGTARTGRASLFDSQALTEVLCEITPHAVDVSAAVARVVVFHQEGGTLQESRVWVSRLEWTVSR